MDETVEGKKRAPRVSYGPVGVILYYLYFFLDGYDGQTLPVCMRAFEVSLGLSPASTSVLATVELMAMLGCCPLWGHFADRFDVNYVVAAAMSVSGIVCILLGCASNYSLIIFLRFLHGFSLSCTAPAMQKIITDSIDEKSHGTHFGFCHSISCLGRLVSSVVTTYLSMMIIMGYYGWRVCYFVFGFAWVVMAICTVFFMKPKETTSAPVESKTVTIQSNGSIFEAIKATFATKTSWILLFTIYISDAPFGAFVYMISYLQYTGLSDFMAGVGCATALVGGFIGGAIGGQLIDLCNDASPRYGRLTAGTMIVIGRVVIVLALFLGPLPANGRLAWFHYLEFALLGASLLTVSSVDRPIMAGVVEQQYQASANAINRCFAGIPSSATFVPLCGFLAEKAFGYIPTKESVQNMSEELKATNSQALGRSIMYIICVGTIINVGCYVAMFFTYPKDSEMIKQKQEEQSLVLV
ncbi:putative transporter [Babesia divergens]|uniref:Transporter n=1 Tax=Babesia divergens TaxID=32595 RepID=A0AAD9LHF5_BABDI|nr:putative transporter [Babesia divergens]